MSLNNMISPELSTALWDKNCAQSTAELGVRAVEWHRARRKPSHAKRYAPAPGRRVLWDVLACLRWVRECRPGCGFPKSRYRLSRSIVRFRLNRVDDGLCGGP